MSAKLEAAVMFAEAGAPVFRVNPKTNGPLLKAAHQPGDPLYKMCKGECGKLGHGFHDATTDVDTVRQWWTQNPHAAIGVRTGVAFDVLDVDHTDYAVGVADLPDCETDGGPVVRSGGGKWHLYFRPTGLGRMIRFSKHCDWLGTDGYVIVPPSGHKDGGTYSWFAPFDLELHAPPAELLARLRPIRTPPPAAKPSNRRTFPTGGGRWSPVGLIGQVATATDGNRNDTLVWAAHRVGLDVRSGKANRSEGDGACQELERVALMIGLGDLEVRGTITSGYAAGLAGKIGKRVAA